MGVLGKIVTYSLSTDLEIEWTLFFSIAKGHGIPYELIPTPTFKNKKDCVMQIKEVRRNIAKVLEYNLGVSVRQNGGAVFIPQERVADWDIYQSVITNEKLSGIDIITLDIADTTENKKTIVKGLLNEIKNSLRDEVYRLNKQKPPDSKMGDLVELFLRTAYEHHIKLDATENMYNRLLGLQDKIKQYERFLNTDLGYIKTNMDVAIKGFKLIYDERKQEYIDKW